jgi:gamma-glutamyltranspeptidase / glutathione hydrolase
MRGARFLAKTFFAVFLVFVGLSSLGFAESPQVITKPAVAAAHPLAQQAGYEVLKGGGNAFDAAVAVAASLAVVEPFSSGLGGGGFFLLHRSADAKDIMLDARETAPSNATRDMYLDKNGHPIAKSSLLGARAAAIPGMPAALVWLAEKYGVLPLKRSLAPAIRFAKSGFVVDARYICMTRDQVASSIDQDNAARIFMDHGRVPSAKFRLRQKQLARTLESIARFGNAGFYQGRVAKELVSSVRAASGIWTLEDLAQYGVIEREPIKIKFRGAIITIAALPSSGGITLAQSLNILSELPQLAIFDSNGSHYVVEAMRRAYHDRARYLGDPDYVDVPLSRLLSSSYAQSRAQSISAERATASSELAALEETQEGNDTTHFSIVDKDGNRVAATLSINTTFGSQFVAGSTGVLLNNHMDDFSIAPGVPNAYGLVGGDANAIAPGKRPLSSMSPSFVEDKKGVLIFGTPGGSRIISMVLLGILDYVGNSAVDLSALVNRPRYHHQYLPDITEIEPKSFNPGWIRAMEDKGHTIQLAQRRWGNMQAIFIDNAGNSTVANDDRGVGCN